MASNEKLAKKKCNKGTCWCSAPNCHKSKQKNPNISFLRFSKDAARWALSSHLKTALFTINIVILWKMLKNCGYCIENRKNVVTTLRIKCLQIALKNPWPVMLLQLFLKYQILHPKSAKSNNYYTGKEKVQLAVSIT